MLFLFKTKTQKSSDMMFKFMSRLIRANIVTESSSEASSGKSRS